MYIKNPNKKVSYSFRINPNTLEDLKLYARATNNTVPEIINQLITDKLDGITLENDYLKHYKDILITIPDLQTIFDNTNGFKMLETMDLQNPFIKGIVFKVKRVPNNLDVWDITDNEFNQHGFISYNFPKTIHEGIEFVLAPELLNKDILKEEDITKTQILLTNTILLPIWFKVNHNNTVSIELITFREAIEKVKRANNFTLMDNLSRFKTLTDQVIANVLYETPEKDLYNTLLTELIKLTKVINTGNIFVNATPEGKIHFVPDNKPVKFTTDDQVSKLREENQALQKRVNELENKFNEINNLLDYLKAPKNEKELWEKTKAQLNKTNKK